MSERVWHYTIVQYLPSIIADGEIKLATEYVWEGRPVVWFSTNPRWEETANKSWESNGVIRFLDKDETEQVGQGLARIEVRPEAAPHLE